MPLFNREPKRNADIGSLQTYLVHRVQAILNDMRALGFDPIIFEAKRSYERQEWLYGVGRTHSRNRKPVTWTLNSKHLTGKAVDIISKSKGWHHPEFYRALRRIARQHDMHALDVEQCHIEWRGL